MENQQELARQRENIQVFYWGSNNLKYKQHNHLERNGIHISEQRKPGPYKSSGTKELVLQYTVLLQTKSSTNLPGKGFPGIRALLKHSSYQAWAALWPEEGGHLCTCPVQPLGRLRNSSLCPHTLMVHSQVLHQLPSVLGTQVTSHDNESRTNTALVHLRLPEPRHQWSPFRENSSPGVCVPLWQSGLNKCPQSKLVWNFCPALDHGHLTNPESLQQSVYWEVNWKGKQTKKRELYLYKNILFGFVLTEGTKPACLKDFCTTIYLPTKLQVKMWKI